MRYSGFLALTCLLAVAGASAASAQIFGFPTQPQANPCQGFVPIRDEVQKTLLTLKTANERKAPREEFCQIFQRLSSSTGKMVKFMEEHKVMCSIPADAVKQARLDHSKSLGFRKQACSAAPAGGPSLSDVLGAPVLPDSSSSNKPDMGTFNTLTGNPLAR